MALSDGADSPMTQTFGLGMAGAVSAADMEALEGFFNERGAPTQHEVRPLAGAVDLRPSGGPRAAAGR
jgi:hypothetical protein